LRNNDLQRAHRGASDRQPGGQQQRKSKSFQHMISPDVQRYKGVKAST
jgi:hypothetical protein